MKACTHIKADGTLCRALPMHHQSRCYFHHRAEQRQRQIIKGRRLPILATLEDQASIQFALMEVVARLSMGSLDPQTARLVLHALRIASINLRTGRFTSSGWQDLRPAAIAKDAEQPKEAEPRREDSGEVFLRMMLGDEAADEAMRNVHTPAKELGRKLRGDFAAKWHAEHAEDYAEDDARGLWVVDVNGGRYVVPDAGLPDGADKQDPRSSRELLDVEPVVPDVGGTDLRK